MGRKNKYETHVQPHLAEIPKMYETMTEGQIAAKLGVSSSSWENYKNAYPELMACLRQGKEILIDELKGNLKKKALGYYYTETKKTFAEDENGRVIGGYKVEQYEKYAAPDTGAIHLLLKNLDDDWHNDDKQTMDLKKEQLELARQKAEADAW